MSKVITFSRTFPSYHPRKGEPTYFVEKIVGDLVMRDVKGCGTELIKSLRDSNLLSISALNEIYNGTYGSYKGHTIRAGHRFKVGDWFSPRVWSGKPYNSKQIIIAPDIQVKKIWDFEIRLMPDISFELFLDRERLGADTVGIIAGNDGLSFVDFMHWFKYPSLFDGQIICWNENIEY